jgi:hypothetical protein
VTVDPPHRTTRIPWRRPPVTGNEPIFWFVTWLSVALAGGLFGIIVCFKEEPEAAIFGFIGGIIIAGVYAIPVVATFGILTWTLWLSRFAVITAAIAGACTGILSTATLAGAALDFELIPLAGCIGGGMTACITGIHSRKLRQLEYAADVAAGDTWQFSLRDLFLRFTIATAILAAWMFALTNYFQVVR